MTSTRKEMQKTLKGPDQFQVKMMGFLDWLMRNTRLVVAIVTPLLLIAAGAMGWRYYQEQRKVGRLEEVGAIQAVYDEELRGVSKQRDEIQKKVEAIDQAVAKAGGTPSAQQTADKEALTKQMEAMKPDHSGSLTKFQDYFAKNQNSAEGWMAGLSAAQILLDQEKYPEARSILETVQKESGKDSFYQTTSRMMLVGILEEQGEFDKALTEVQALEGAVDKDTKAQVLLVKGRLQMLKGATDEAKATFNGIVDGYANAPEAQKARSMLALLN